VPIGWKLATEPHIIGGLACYVISVVVWIMALSRVPVSVAYPMLSIGYIVNAFAAWMLFGESLAVQKRLRSCSPRQPPCNGRPLWDYASNIVDDCSN